MVRMEKNDSLWVTSIGGSYFIREFLVKPEVQFVSLNYNEVEV